MSASAQIGIGFCAAFISICILGCWFETFLSDRKGAWRKRHPKRMAVPKPDHNCIVRDRSRAAVPQGLRCPDMP